MLAGRSGVRLLDRRLGRGDCRSRSPAGSPSSPTEVLERVKARRLDRSSQFAMVAAMEAWADSGLDGAPGGRRRSTGERLGVAMASGIGGVTTLLDNYDTLKEKGPRRVSPLAVPMLMPNAPAANISLYVGARAAVNTPVSACASGNEAIALGARPDPARPGRRRRRGRHRGRDPPAADGGVRQHDGAVEDATARGGDPTTVSRPWDTGRDGFVLGEGAGVLVLESEEHALARGARIYAEVLGAGITADSHDIAQPDPAGRGGARAILRALAEARPRPGDIVHINAHATSTPQGDIAEGLMIHATLGAHANDVVVTSTKSMTGHLLGGAGALEAVATILALHHRVVAADDQPRRPRPAGRARHRHQAARPAAGRHRGAEQLLRLRRRQRRRRLRVVDHPAKFSTPRFAPP